MKIAVFGSNGRVGKRVCALAKKQGHSVWEVEKDTNTENLDKVDVVIDFATPAATACVCKFCKRQNAPLITGVTGRNAEQQAALEELKERVTILESSNFSTGIAKLTEICRLLSALNWDCEIVETHRKGKTDSPSGTARMLATAISQNGTREVCVHSLRCGSNFGKHEVVFATEGESITVTHQAENTDIFALGALREAEKLVKTKADTEKQG